MLSVTPRTSFLESFSPGLRQHMKLASWKKEKGVVRGKMRDGRGCSCETGVRPSFEWNSLHGSEFRLCSVALWLAEERWNENHSKLLTPAQELCRNAQPQLWRGGTEPALFLCLLHQSNRDGGERRRRREHREGGETDTRARGRKGREKIVRAALRSENEYLLFTSGTVETCTQTHTLLLKSKVRAKHSLLLFFFIKVKSFKKILPKVITVVDIFSHWIIWDFSSHCICISCQWRCVCYQTGQHGGRSGPGTLALQIKGCLAID